MKAICSELVDVGGCSTCCQLLIEKHKDPCSSSLCEKIIAFPGKRRISMGKEKLIGSCEAYSLVPIFTMSRQALQNFFVVVVKKNLFPHAIIILRFFKKYFRARSSFCLFSVEVAFSSSSICDVLQ